MPAPNPVLIVLARESRGYSQTDLADMIGVRQGTLSKVESGLIPASDELVERLVSTLNYPRGFFYEEFRPKNLPLTFYRKRTRVSAGTLRTTRAAMNLRCREVAKLLRSADTPVVRTPAVSVAEYRGHIEQIARDVRMQWHLPAGPVDHVTRTLEGAGVLVLRWDFGTRQIDALSIFDPDDELPPLIFANPDVPGDRWRWTLAHELGHIVMHHHLPVIEGDVDVEGQANRFASEFLMPTSDIRGYLTRPSLEKLASLKPHWKVSMGALLERAASLGKITERQRRYLWMMMGRYGYRTAEPVTIPLETPTLIDELIEYHLVKLGYAERELTDVLTLGIAEFKHLYRGNRAAGGLRAVK
jgi:Zn-dependent peptidase ImmA (M78 family)/DNA-binding XRE family transcriptional regulator